MKRALHFIKKDSKIIPLGINNKTCLISESLKLNEDSIYILGREPDKIWPRLKSDTKLSNAFRFVSDGDYSIETLNVATHPYPYLTKSVSSVHCAIYSKNGEIYIMDLGSKNGTVVNDETVTGIRRLYEADNISLGDMEFGICKIPDYSKRMALVLGIDHKQDLKTGVRNSANGIEALLEAREFSQDNIFKHIYDENGTTGELKPTKKAIMGQLEFIANVQDDDGLTVIFYNGHGAKDGSLCLPSEWYNKILPKKSRSTAIIPAELNEAVAKIKGYKLMIIDSCHSGKIKRYFDRNPIEKTVVICSAKPEQLAAETLHDQFAVFTKQFLRYAANDITIRPELITHMITMHDQDHTTFINDKIKF